MVDDVGKLGKVRLARIISVIHYDSTLSTCLDIIHGCMASVTCSSVREQLSYQMLCLEDAYANNSNLTLSESAHTPFASLPTL